jgi:hypothetical protein
VCRRVDEKQIGAGDDLYAARILYVFTPISEWIFCFTRLITLSTEFTELPRTLAISSLE